MKKDVYVLCGGKSVEHDVSLISATGIINSLDREKYNVIPIYISEEGYWTSLGVIDKRIEDPKELKIEEDKLDNLSVLGVIEEIAENKNQKIVFPALHGTFGEDGNIQGFLNVLNVPYVGNDIGSSVLAMDKAVSKDIFKLKRIPQANYCNLNKKNWIDNKEEELKKIKAKINFPMFVKPSRSGSSIGINRAKDEIELIDAVETALFFDNKIVVEEELIGREMQVSVIGNENPKVSVVGEFIQEKRFMDYNAKYIDGKLIQVIEANLSKKASKYMRDLSIKAYNALNCNGLARIDYFVCDDEKIYVNEINTMPGFTMLSMTPALWEKTDGTSYSDLLDILIGYGEENYRAKNSLVYTRKIK